jgi:hypothetical protein
MILQAQGQVQADDLSSQLISCDLQAILDLQATSVGQVRSRRRVESQVRFKPSLKPVTGSF